MNTIGLGFFGRGFAIKLCKLGIKFSSKRIVDVDFFDVDFLGVNDFFGVNEGFLGAIILVKEN